MHTIGDVAARRSHAAYVGTIALLLCAVTVLVLPIADQAWDQRPWFQAMHLTAVVLLDGLIALFLTIQILAGDQIALAWLASGYAFASVMGIEQFFAFPGILAAPIQAGSAGAQVAMWNWVLWHAGFPYFVLAGAWAAQPCRSGPVSDRIEQRINIAPVIAGAAGGLMVAYLLPRYVQRLPHLITDHLDYHALAGGYIAYALIALNAVALLAVVYVTRLRTLLSLWLALGLFAFMLDVVVTLAGSSRYSAGWYVGRCLSLASSAALMVALMIQHFILHRDAERRADVHAQEARHDPLTGLFNRRHLGAELDEEFARAKRHHHALSLLLVDIDHFKGINDQWGHLVGDQCLKAVAQTLNERVHRSGDFTARFGGEEFAVVLPETGSEAAVDVAEEIRRRVEALYGQQRSPSPITISIGVATASPTMQDSVEGLVSKADEGLYKAKQQGRNRVIRASL